MISITYKHPPITEAVIEIEFTKPHGESAVRKFLNKAKDLYENHNEEATYVVDIDTKDVSPTAETIQKLVHRLASNDMTQQLLVHESSLIVAQLAPYPGWDEFFARFVRDWKAWKRYAGFNQVKKIGVRYINRLDVPATGDLVMFPEYVNIYPHAIQGLGPNLSYSVHVRYKIDELNAHLLLQTTVVKSPLLNHMSLLLDQDIGRLDDVPQSDEDIQQYLINVHVVKNRIFESCITDKARALFNKE